MLDGLRGDQLLQWLEGYQVHQRRKLALVRTMFTEDDQIDIDALDLELALTDDQIDIDALDLELALTVLLKKQFPQLPDEVLTRVVPHLEGIKAENFFAKLPWNRHKRRRLMRAKHVVVHCFWDKHCGDAHTEILCVDTVGSSPASLHDKGVYGFLLLLCAMGKVRSIIGGPPCRTVSALRYQSDNGPGVLRSDAHPYGLPDLSPSDLELVLGDSVLMFRFWSLLVLAEEVRDEA
eukprot:s12_g27.t1